jgi:hypothetical protein
MPYKLENEKEFKVNDKIQIVCYWQNTSYGFRHIAKLFKDNYQIDQKSCAYYNRTWETFTYESVLFYLVRKTRFLTPEEKETANQFIKDYKKIDEQEVNKKFGMIAGIAQLADVLIESKQAKNSWKERMLKAGIKEIDFPDNWNDLSEDEKESRLKNVQKEMIK